MSDNIKILKNYLIYFLLMIFVFMVGISDIFADTYNNIGYLNNLSYVDIKVGYTSNLLPLQIENTYQLDQVEEMYIEIDNYSFNGGTTYSIEFYTPHTELYTSNSFGVLGTTSNNEPVFCDTSGIDSSDTAHLNFRFNCSKAVNNIKINIFSPSGGYILPAGIFSWNYVYLRELVSSSSNSILESQNAQIIQGQQDIINNQNANTDKQIESQKVCEYIDKNNVIVSNKLLNSLGEEQNQTNWGITDYIKVEKSNIKVLEKISSNNSYLCFYDINKTKLSCITNNSLTENSIIDIPNNTSYVRFSISLSLNQPQLQICKNGNQALNDSITDLNDSLNDADSSGATSEASEFFSSFTTNTFGLTSIITAPLNLIQSLTSSTCSQLHLPLPYLNNKYLDLPCMTSIYQTHFGAFFTMYQTITYGIIAYWVIVRIFNQVKDFKNPEHDEIEVVDL